MHDSRRVPGSLPLAFCLVSPQKRSPSLAVRGVPTGKYHLEEVADEPADPPACAVKTRAIKLSIVLQPSTG